MPVSPLPNSSRSQSTTAVEAYAPSQSNTYRPTSIEVCCGSAGLSASLRKAGIQVFPVDHHGNKHATKAKPVVLDLTLPKDQAVFKQLCYDSKPEFVHMGLPCGTCSRAREKPLPGHLAHLKPPQPLRSQDHLMGLDDLNHYDQLKVSKANTLYRFAVWILEFCYQHSVLISIENPHRSWLWQILALLVKQQGNSGFSRWYASLQSTVFAACQHGGSRDKQTKLLATPNLFEVLAAECQGDHQHASWQPKLVNGQLEFPTALEAEYPKLLCDRMAECVVEQLRQLGRTWTIDPSIQTLLKRQVGIQTVKTPQLLAEFSHFSHLEEPYNDDSHKLIAAPITTGDETEQQTKRRRTTYKYGVLRSPETFLQESLKLDHPIDGESRLQHPTKQAIDFVVDNDPIQVAKERIEFIASVKRWKKELASDELSLKKTLDPTISDRHSTKNILLFKKLLEVTDFDDTEVVDLLLRGVPLVGYQGPPKGFKEQLVPATMSEEELAASSLWRRKSLMSSSKAMTKEDQEELMKSATEEVASGFLVGPFSEEEMSAHFNSPNWLLNPRFVIYQGESRKVRVIDDAKASALNCAYSSAVKLELQDADYIAAMAFQLMKRASRSRHVSGQHWLGKTFDLSKAYKQLAVTENHQRFSVVGFRYHDKWLFYKSVALPFGATGSVYAFVRMSRAIWHVLTTGLRAVISHYFDDYPTLECASGAKVLSLAVESLLDELGWQYAKEGDKALSFGEAFDALGVNFRLERLHLGGLTLQNKSGRVDKICNMLDRIAAKGRISCAEASEVQGLLNFASGYFLTRSLRHLVSAFLPLADVLDKPDEVAQLCRYATSVLRALGPREHGLQDEKQPIVIFTDAAWEHESASAGLVICDPISGTRHCRAIGVPDKLVEHWRQGGIDQVISQAELFALLAVRYGYRDLMRHRRCLCWIDNEAARFTAIKSSSPSASMRAMARFICEVEISHPAFLWYERVPSFSNPADLPSRQKVRQACQLMQLDEVEPLHVSEHLVASIISYANTPYSSFTRGDTLLSCTNQLVQTSSSK